MNDNTPITYEGEAPDDGWSKVPHGLWTLDVPPQARLLLGWLHSHHPRYRARLSVRSIRREFGTGGAARSLAALEAAGLLTVHRAGQQSRIVLDVPAYFALGRVAPSGCQSPAEGGTQQVPVGGTQQVPVVAPSGGHEEDHGEDQVEKTTSPLAPQGAAAVPAVPDGFAAFWSEYPRKVGKPVAQRCYARAIERHGATPEDVLAGLRPWVAYWAARNEPEYVPHPSTWLGQHRWQDAPPPLPRVGMPTKTAAGMAVLDRLRAVIGPTGTHTAPTPAQHALEAHSHE